MSEWVTIVYRPRIKNNAIQGVSETPFGAPQ
jgi:hypothetical protein